MIYIYETAVGMKGPLVCIRISSKQFGEEEKKQHDMRKLLQFDLSVIQSEVLQP